MGTIPRNELLFNPEHPEAAPGFFKHSRQHSLAQRTPRTASLPCSPSRQATLDAAWEGERPREPRPSNHARIFKQSRQHSLAQRTPRTASLPAGPPDRQRWLPLGRASVLASRARLTPGRPSRAVAGDGRYHGSTFSSPWYGHLAES